MDIDRTEQRRAFGRWLRTGRLPTVSGDGVELKFNPWHNPDDGRFTHAGTGRYFGPGGTPSAVHPAGSGRKDAPAGKRADQRPLGPAEKITELASGFGESLHDLAKENATALYDAATTNPLKTLRHASVEIPKRIAKTIDSVIAAEETPARIQVRRAAHAIANASTHDVGYAMGRIAGNVALTAAPGAAVAKISSIRRATTIRPRETFHQPSVTWRKETIVQRGKAMAKLYNDTAPGARAGQAPALRRTMPDGSRRPVKFDGIDGDYLIDRKWSIRRNQKSKDQAIRQSTVLYQHRLIGIWKVPSKAMRREAVRFLKSLGIRNIHIRIVEP